MTRWAIWSPHSPLIMVGIFLMGAAFTATAVAEEKLSTEDVKAKARMALGWSAFEKLQQGLVLSGSCVEHGLDGSWHCQISPRGEFLERTHTKLGQTLGFDGKVGWTVDWSGMTWSLQLDDLDKERLRLGVLAGCWLAENSPIQIVSMGPGADNGEIRLHLRFERGAQEADLALDRKTWLPKHLTRQGMTGEEIWEFQGFQEIMGISVPLRLVQRIGDLRNVYNFESAKPAPVGEKNAYLMPARKLPRDTRFDQDLASKVEVKRTASGHLFVRPKVNGLDVGWFAFDTGTGASMTFSASAADKLGLPAFGQSMGGGAGKPMPMRFRQCATLQLGPIEITNSIGAELPRDFTDTMTKLFGFEWAGTIGSDFLARTVTELDLAEPAIHIHNPETYRLPEGHWDPIQFSHRIPCLNCKFDGGREGLFRFDTGAGSVVVLHAPAVARLKLLKSHSTQATKVGGVGGATDARLGKLEYLEISGQRIPNVPAIFFQGSHGALTDSHALGTFGSGILGPWKVVFDYANQRVAFIPKAMGN